MLPEMLEAGLEALEEAKKRNLTPHDTVITVYLAMRALEEIAEMRRKFESVH